MRVLEPVIYKLNLLDSIKIMRICHISVLKLADLGAPLMEDIPNINPKSQEKIWKVKKILNLDLIINNK